MNKQLIVKGLCLLLVLAFFEKNQLAAQDSLAVSMTLRQLSATIDGQIDHSRFGEAMASVDMASKKYGDEFGPRHFSAFEILSIKGRLFLAMSQPGKAVVFLEESLAWRDGTKAGTANAHFADMVELCRANADLGHYKMSEILLGRLQKLASETPVGTMDQYAISLTAGTLSLLQGQLEKAEPLLLAAKTELEKPTQKGDRQMILTLNSLSNLYQKLGQPKKAAEFSDQAIAQIEKSGLQNTLAHALVLTTIGNRQLEARQYPLAAEPLEKAKTIIEKTIGTENEMYARLLNSRGYFFYAQKKLDEAELLFQRARTYYETSGMSCEECYNRVLTNLARVNLHKKNYELAAQYFQKALQSIERNAGQQNENYQTTLLNLFQAYQLAEKPGAADSVFYQSLAIERQLANRATGYFSQQELAAYLPKICFGHNWMGYLTQAIPTTDVWKRAYFDVVLYQKGYLLQSALAANRMLENAGQPIKATHNDWKATNRALTTNYAKPFSVRGNVDSLEIRANLLEKDLLNAIPGFAGERRDVRSGEVQAELLADEAAIEFVFYKASETGASEEKYYAALVLLPGDGHPTFVPLFKGSELAQLTNRSRSWLSDYTEKLYAFAQPETTKSLHQLIWEPIEMAIGQTVRQINKTYFSPAGQLHLLNLAAIEMPDGSRISQKYQLVELGSTRQIVAKNTPKTTGAHRSALVFGGIQYDMDSLQIRRSVANLGLAGRAENTRSLDLEQADSTLRGGSWNYLPATEKEAQYIHDKLVRSGFQTKMATGFSATEEAFKAAGAVGGPQVLHVATHGFFFPDPAKNPKPGGPVFKVSENPMIRSGLVLAGANHAWKTGQTAQNDLEDGILTALEISQLDLSDTELVVLSACETGLGDIEGNEGVYGLQRAFKIAGAHYLMMSLWKVDDQKTAEMMGIFYEKWLGGAVGGGQNIVGGDTNNGQNGDANKGPKMEVPAAFRAAQAEMRAKYPNPFYWAGFVLVE